MTPSAAPSTGGSSGGSADPEFPALLPGLLRSDPGDVDLGRPARRSPRDWAVDTVAFLLAVGIGLIGYDTALVNNDPPEVVQLLDLVGGGLACIALWWRRSRPIELSVVCALLSAGLTSVAGAAAVALFTVAVHRRFVVAAGVATLNAVSGASFYALYPEETTSWPESVALTVLFVAVVTVWGMFVRARRQLVLSLRARAHQAEAESALRVERARHLERERIAREMHDVLAHRISLLSVHAGALEYRPDAPREDVARAAGVIRASAHQALQDLREVIGVLRTQPGDDAHGSDPERPQPTLADVRTLVDESRQAGMRVTLADGRADDTEPPQAVGRCAYRVVQEGLTNARKHADGASVRVRLDGAEGSGLDIEISNKPPVGSAAPDRIPGAGSGLVGLAERVELTGGRLQHGHTPGGDFRLHAWLPWPA